MSKPFFDDDGQPVNAVMPDVYGHDDSADEEEKKGRAFVASFISSIHSRQTKPQFTFAFC